MSKSVSSIAILLAVFVLSFIATASAISISEHSNAFDITRDLLNAFYPEIFGSGRYINFSTGQPVDNSTWGQVFGFEFTVTRFGPHVSWNPTFDAKTGGMAPRPENTLYLQGSSWVGHHGEILRFLVDGDLACSRQESHIRELVQSHPEWSEEQAVHALKEAGGRFGPAEKQQFVDSLHLERAERILGRLKVKLVEFDGVNPNHIGSFASLIWIVQAEGTLEDGTRRTYGLSFEPFNGKLIGLNQIPNREYPR